MKDKIKTGIEVFVQIFLLVVATFAFSYLVGDVFSLVKTVSAQTENPLEQSAQESGYQTDFEDVEDSASAASDFSSDLGDSIESGSNKFEGFLGILDNILPKASETSSSDFFSSLLDSTGGAYICPETKNGEICQPMLGNDCGAECDVECIEGTFEELPENSECKLITCYDEDEGICEPRSTKEQCEDFGGQSLDDPNGNAPECVQGCCVIADQAFFVTERQCIKRTEDVGVELGAGASFSSGGGELNCLASALEKTEGACVFSIANELEDGCKFTTSDECSSISGNFFEKTLCSNSDLDTGCLKQNHTSCVEGLDEVYWIDSCGNKENIYEGDSGSKRDDSYFGGLVKLKEDSCLLGGGDDPIRHQSTCGNCNRLRGSFCGGETDNPRQELGDDPDGGVVCRDLGCYDEEGERIREHGESWCAYQGQIGLAGPDTGALDILRGSIPSNPVLDLIAGDKSVDTPGSIHFRKSCLNGEISTTPCGNYRNELCEETRTEIEGSEREFSQASCRVNRWQECLAYNPGATEGRIIGMAGEASGKIIKAKLELTCGLDPDCFVKDVNVDKGFQFSYCAPRYPPGFDVKNNPEAADQICAQASQTCTAIYIKKLSGWECEVNCECEEEIFAKQLNELCVSLGDCGATVNYVGASGVGGYSLSEDGKPQLGGPLAWINNINQGSLLDIVYANPLPGEYVHSNAEIIEGVRGNWIDEIFANFGLNNLFGGGGGGESGVPEVDATGLGFDVAKVSGGVGASLVAVQLGSSVTTLFGLTSANLAAACAGCMGFAGATLGAAAGAAIIGFLADTLGISRGIGKGGTYALMGAGAVGGYMMGASAISGGSIYAACNNPIGCYIVAVVIAIELILALFGVGDIDEREIKFECKPWAPPLIGDCESCGEDKLSDGTETFPCNEYSCVSLGQTCEYVPNSEGPDGGQCISVSVGDVSFPRIESLNEEVLSEGFRYREFSDVGFKIRRMEGNECLSQFESLTFGFDLDEHGRCSISGERKDKFEEMTPLADGLRIDHRHIFNFFDLEDLEIELEQGEANPVGLYLACEDYLGNNNADNPYIINLCIDPEDFMPPLITHNNGNVLVSFDAETQDITVFVNEPSDVRWDFEDVPFEEMENEFVCDFETRVPRGFACTAEIPIDSDVDGIFVRANDHPELEGTDEEGDRNQNQESVQIIITRSESALQIDLVSPDDEIIISGTPIASVNIAAETSGGLNGAATCYYSVDSGSEDVFSQTDGTTHSQLLSQVTEGVHVWDVRCIDEAQNIAEKTATFSVEVESTTPNIGRVYSDSGLLFVVTNEPAECSYKDNGCNFEVSDGDTMDSLSGGLVHTTGFDSDKEYHIKCKDEYGNEQIGCDIVVTGGLF